MGDVDLAKVLDPDFVADLDGRSTADLRELRGACEAVEATLSFRRRVLHGHMDLLREEVQRRGDRGRQAADALGPASTSAPAEARSPSHQRISTDLLELQLAGVADEVRAVSADLPDCTDEELRLRADALVTAEAELSAMRRTVLDRLDTIQSEIVRRYRDGAASIDELLPPAT